MDYFIIASMACAVLLLIRDWCSDHYHGTGDKCEHVQAYIYIYISMQTYLFLEWQQ